ncbi:phosphoserine aminotransferase [Aeribacillus pallidus]|uniref:phosphoserine aminotransferase n=1 Tax=Aeribacillus pallidus TaxID=33936 RepID=UPI0018DF2BA1|nr:phosphoserine aminotransferase [Aeribacillus pallidus]
MDTVNVNYIPSEWERTKKGIGNLIGVGVWGKGMIDNLKDISDLLEDAQSDIAKYDSDGVISFTHTDRKSQYQSLYEDFLVMHRFSGRIGDIVDRTIDEPFYQDIDAFVEAMRDLSISEIKTKNRIGAKETIVVPGTYGTQETIEVPKAEVGLEDLFSGSNYYARLMEREYASWKELNPHQDFSEKEYIKNALNSYAFQYESIKDGQMNKEFWGQIAALVVIVGVSFICPPAGMALGMAYGTLELSSAVSGKDWISGRELETGERVFRGALAPLDIVPGVSALSKFSSAARFAPLREAMDPKLFTSLKAGLHQKSQRACDLVVRADQDIVVRIRNAKAWTKEMPQHLKTGAKKGSLQVGRFVDNAATNLRHLLPSRQMGLAIEGVGNVKVPPENTKGLENKVRAYLSEKTGVNLGGSKAGNDGVELGTKGTGKTVKLPSQGTVDAGVPGAPKVDAGKQGKHVLGHPNSMPGKKTQWPEGEDGVKLTQEAWVKGTVVKPDGSVKIYDFHKPIGVNGETRVKVHMDKKGNIHGYPVK